MEAGDFTLASSACDKSINMGIDACFVTDGDPIVSDWKLIVPFDKTIVAGEVDVYFKDKRKQYKIEDNVIKIDWSDFFGSTNWDKSMDGEALALVMVQYEHNGVKEIAKFRGIAKLVVAKKGYDRMPVGSGFQQWVTDCHIEYSTSGRSAIDCK